MKHANQWGVAWFQAGTDLTGHGLPAYDESTARMICQLYNKCQPAYTQHPVRMLNDDGTPIAWFLTVARNWWNPFNTITIKPKQHEPTDPSKHPGQTAILNAGMERENQDSEHPGSDTGTSPVRHPAQRPAKTSWDIGGPASDG